MNENKKALAGAGTPTGAVETAALGAATVSYSYFTTPATVRQVAAYLPVGGQVLLCNCRVQTSARKLCAL